MNLRNLVAAIAIVLGCIAVSASDYEARIAAIARMSGARQLEAIKCFVKDTGKNEDTAEAATLALENNLLSASSSLHDENLYIAFVEEMLRVGYPNRVRNEWMLSAVNRNRPGSTLPTFEYDTRDGVRHSSAELRGSITVLMFYDPDCSDCSEAIARFQSDSRICAAIEDGKLRIVCIYADGDMDSWISSYGKIPAAWTDGIDTGRIADEELFLLPTTPTIYIVDAEGKILRKEALVEDVLNLAM